MVDENTIINLWDLGYSRNRIGSILHVSHAKVGQVVKGLPRERHDFNLQKRRERINEDTKIVMENHAGLSKTDARNIVSQHKDLGIRARFDPTLKSVITKLIRLEGSP